MARKERLQKKEIERKKKKTKQIQAFKTSPGACQMDAPV